MFDFELDYSIKDFERRNEIVHALLGENGGEIEKWLSSNFESPTATKIMERLSNYLNGGKLQKEHAQSPTPTTKREDASRCYNDPYLDGILSELKDCKDKVREVRDRPENSENKRLYNTIISVISDNMKLIRESHLCPINCFGAQSSPQDPAWYECDYTDLKQVMCLLRMCDRGTGDDLDLVLWDFDLIYQNIRSTDAEKAVYDVFKKYGDITMADAGLLLGRDKNYVNVVLRGLAKKIADNQLELES